MNETLHPFRSIAVCLSGGGHRAAAFSLGSLAYLHHLGILDRVAFLSSTSGGTITNTFYSYRRTKDQSFEDIYRALLEKLQGEELLNRAVAILNDDREWTKGKSRTIINAFAKAYERFLFEEEALFGSFWDQGEQNPEVCFNCTEFSKGLSFRFQTDGRPQSREFIGNNYIYFDRAHEAAIRKIKLADILAASSCFPIGFEPIVLPQDFAHEKLSESELKAALTLVEYDTLERGLRDGECIGLMDGGITDNQALRSAVLSDDRRRRRGKPFDLFFVSDVTSYFIKPYALPPATEKATLERLNLQKVFAGANDKVGSLLRTRWWFGLLAAAASVPGVLVRPVWLKCLLFALAGGAVTASGLGWFVRSRYKREIDTLKRLDDPDNKFLSRWLPSVIESLRQFDEGTVDKLLRFFTTASFKDIWHLLKTRIDSVTNMSAEINLKHARRLIFNGFFADDKWRGRRCANFIYELSRLNRESRQKRIMDYAKWNDAEKALLLQSAGHLMEEWAESARTMGTTLWFSHDDAKADRLKTIVATGQFSACANLLEYTINLEKGASLDAGQRDEVQRIRHQLEDDWKGFLQEPAFLYDRLKGAKPGSTQRNGGTPRESGPEI